MAGTPAVRRQKPVTGHISPAELDEFRAVAFRRGTKPSPLTTELVRKFLADERAKAIAGADDFEDCDQAYGGATVVPA